MVAAAGASYKLNADESACYYLSAATIATAAAAAAPTNCAPPPPPHRVVLCQLSPKAHSVSVVNLMNGPRHLEGWWTECRGLLLLLDHHLLGLLGRQHQHRPDGEVCWPCEHCCDRVPVNICAEACVCGERAAFAGHMWLISGHWKSSASNDTTLCACVRSAHAATAAASTATVAYGGPSTG